MTHLPFVSLGKSNLLIIIAVLLGVLLFGSVESRADTITVDSFDDVDDGACDATHCSLREAIQYASAGDTIEFSVTGTITLGGSQLVIDKNLTISGPGAGQLAVSGNNSSRVFYINSGVTATLSGLTIRDGKTADGADGSGDDGGDGGGVYNKGTLTIQNSTVRDNSSGQGGNRTGDYYGGGDGGDGGGVYNKGTLTIENSMVSGNSTGNGGDCSGDECEGGWGGGGGVYNRGSLTIENSTVSGNSAGNGGACSGEYCYSGYGGYGGGVHNRGTLTIENSTVSGNSAGNGGACSGDNCSGGDGGDGGGVYTHNYNGGSLTITDSTVSGNSTGYGGDCSGPSCHGGNSGNGGGVYVTASSPTLTNVTISGNSAAGRGGGVYHIEDGYTLTLAHCTITNNTSDSDEGQAGDHDDGDGGGIYRHSGTLNLKNSIVAGNDDLSGSASTDDCANWSGSISSQGYNLVGDGTGCNLSGTTDQTTSDARLDALADNGPSSGSGQATETHALFSDSPARDVIPYETNGCGTDYATDQRGEARPYPAEGSCDIGAYERVPYPEIDVQGQNISIADGDTTPDAADDTHFGSVAVEGGTVSHTFTIENKGTIDLTLDGATKVEVTGAHAADFMVTAEPASPVAPDGGTTTFTVEFDPGDGGQRDATISIANNDDNENPYDFAIQGTGLVPEMDVQGNSVSIVDGDTTPDAADDTDFGGANVSAGTTSHIFTIENSGDVDLILDGDPKVAISGAHAADFTVTSQPVSPVAPGGTTTFTVEFDPGDGGQRDATISIANNDDDENPYDFSIQGTGKLLTMNATDDVDDGVCTLTHCSLREAIANAEAGDAIDFDPSLNGGTITLGGGQLVIDKDLTISGPGAGQLAVSGNNSSRVFYINSGVTATLSGLTIRDGKTADGNSGGGIGGYGGGIYNNGTLTIENSTVRDNSTGKGGVCSDNYCIGGEGGRGGGVHNNQGTLTIRNSTVSGNITGEGG